MYYGGGFNVIDAGYLDGWSIGVWSDIGAITLGFGRYIMDGGICVYNCYCECLMLVWGD